MSNSLRQESFSCCEISTEEGQRSVERQRKSGHTGSHKAGIECRFCLKGKETTFCLGQDYTFCHMRLQEHQETNRTVGVNLLKDSGGKVIGPGGLIIIILLLLLPAQDQARQNSITDKRKVHKTPPLAKELCQLTKYIYVCVYVCANIYIYMYVYLKHI